jgi:hypothetical protein
MKNTNFNASYLCKNTEEDWHHYLWKCELITSKGRITTSFKMGLAHVIKSKYKWVDDKPKPPTLEGVLYSLLIDADARNMSFNDWCSDFGYDSDSIKAFNTYQACCESGKKLDIIYTRADIEDIREALQDY